MRMKNVGIRFVAVAVGMSAIVRGYSDEAGVEGSYDVLTTEQLSGDWLGARSSLEEKGLSISGENVYEHSGVLEGGINQTDSWRNLFVADLDVDAETLFNWSGATFFAQFLSVTAENGGTGDSGDLQGYTNIENDRSLNTIYELWFEQVLFDGFFRAKIGKVDSNSEFATVGPLMEFSAAGEFTHSSAGFQPSIAGFASYPDPAMSVNLFITPIDNEEVTLSVGYGLYDGAAGVDGIQTGTRGPSTFFSDDRSDDYLHLLEGQCAWHKIGSLPGGSFGLGGWLHTGTWDEFDGGQKDQIEGIYATFQQQFTAPDEEATDKGLYLFAQYGWGDDSIVEVGHVFSVGLLQNGLGSVRSDDVVGVYA